jgi:hypothetical protein
MHSYTPQELRHTQWSTPHHISYPTPNELHHTPEVRHTPWATQHTMTYASSHDPISFATPQDLYATPLSFAIPLSYATPHEILYATPEISYFNKRRQLQVYFLYILLLWPSFPLPPPLFRAINHCETWALSFLAVSKTAHLLKGKYSVRW